MLNTNDLIQGQIGGQRSRVSGAQFHNACKRLLRKDRLPAKNRYDTIALTGTPVFTCLAKKFNQQNFSANSFIKLGPRSSRLQLELMG